MDGTNTNNGSLGELPEDIQGCAAEHRAQQLTKVA
jgi:hypothetical protein